MSLTSLLAASLPDGCLIPPSLDPPADDARMAELQPIPTSPPLYRPGRTRLRVFGFALTDAFLYDYCVANQIGPLDTLIAISNSRIKALTEIERASGLRYASVVKTVYTGKVRDRQGVLWPEYALCLVLANNKTEEMRQRPMENRILRAKRAVGDLTPMWYRMPN
ncbi:hypothetical protein FA95DRAFT_1564304 [Auriscalpium vulgare]|uniref:Uncharacterized protein n=1 Tax=Auriscalpium vulgare TaxID=40419 RepID=A0ACB8REW2_9AGAM|nr:hypothetical protein FA95DRAFT_1564304 [Auriscalpium vulgare]